MKKKIQNFLQTKYVNKLILESDQPIKNSIHCNDIVINGIDIRCRFISPSHKGDKGGLIWSIMTDDQLKERKEIENKFKNEKLEREKISRDYQRKSWEYYSQFASPNRKAKSIQEIRKNKINEIIKK